MIQIQHAVVSRSLFENQFICHLERCEGNCCVHGDAGAPLTHKEVKQLEVSLDLLKPFMRAEGIRSVAESGAWVIDHEGERVTPLVGDEECAYAVFEEGIARCSIENAYSDGKIDFQKPVSCHLYPIRLHPLKKGVALNYHQWSVCEPARILGTAEGVPVFRFLKQAIVRVFGPAFYEEMEEVYQSMER